MTVKKPLASNGVHYDIEATDTIKNCPVVPEESMASLRYGGDAVDSSGLIEGWYESQEISYFLFKEAPLETTGDGPFPDRPSTSPSTRIPVRKAVDRLPGS